MTDKLKNTLFNKPNFVMSEQPTGIKLNASFDQVEDAFQRVEKAIGDMTDYSAENRSLSSVPLHQNSIARFIGPSFSVQEMLNSNQEFEFKDTLALGRNEWHIPFKPYGTDGTLKFALATDSAANEINVFVFASDVSPNMPSATGEYCFDTNQNKLISFCKLTKGTATFIGTSYLAAEAEQNTFPFFSQGLPGKGQVVIPSPLDTSSVLTVSTSGTDLYQYLFQINTSLLQYKSPIYNTSLERYSHTAMLSLGSDSKDLDGLSRFPLSTKAIQYQLPSYIATYSSGAAIPQGFMYVYDINGSNAFVEGTYYARDNTSFYYSGYPVNTASTNKWRTIVGGANITETIEGLLWDSKYHEHIGPRAISHINLKNAGWVGDTSMSPSAPGRGAWRPTVPSNFINAGHVHPQYLARWGWDENNGDEGNLSNLMLGHIFYAASSTNLLSQTYSSAIDGTASKSFRSYWGSTDNWIGLETLGGTNSFLQLRSYNHIFGRPTSGGFQDVYDFQAYHASTNYIFDATNMVEVSSLVTGYAKHFLYNSKRIQFNYVSATSTVTVSNNSTDVRLTGVLGDSGLDIVGGNNLQINIVGKVEATAFNCTSQSYDIVATNFTGTSLSKDGLGTRPGKYCYYDEYILDAKQKRRKPISPLDFKMMGTDTYNYRVETHQIGDSYVAQMPYVSLRAASSNGFIISTGTNDAVCSLGMPGDSYADQVVLNISYQVANLRLVKYLIDGSTASIASTSLPNMNGSQTTIIWDINDSSNFVVGERLGSDYSTYPIDYLLYVENQATATSATSVTLKIHGGILDYYQMR